MNAPDLGNQKTKMHMVLEKVIFLSDMFHDPFCNGVPAPVGDVKKVLVPAGA